MFENLTSTGVVVWIIGLIASKYLIPLLVKTDVVKKAIKVVDKDADVIESPDATFDWKKAELTKYHPFKPVYYVTLGITRSTQNQHLKIENTYLDATEYRDKIAEQEPEETCLISQEPAISKKQAAATAKAVEELYDYVVQYMIKKYPMYFVATKDIVTNLINNEELPRYAKKRDNLDLKDLLRKLCKNVEEDFLLLQAPESGDDEYILRALTGIGANGFLSSSKLNKRLTEIHEPVPQYLERLQLSMNRHFARVQPDQYVQRLTWGIQIGGGIEQIYRPSGQHIGKSEEVGPVVDGSTLDFQKNAFVRVERQVLTRLPKSKFLLLSVRTYMYPLADIKKEGLGGALAKAIRAWPEDVAHYMGRPRWGDAVLPYLDE